MESVATLHVVTAGYSGTPLAAKIGIKEGHRVRLIGAPGMVHRRSAFEREGLSSTSGFAGGSALKMVWRKELRAKLR
jgi:hypothetical protein